MIESESWFESKSVYISAYSIVWTEVDRTANATVWHVAVFFLNSSYYTFDIIDSAYAYIRIRCLDVDYVL